MATAYYEFYRGSSYVHLLVSSYVVVEDTLAV
jgi:hypothetical protein